MHAVAGLDSFCNGTHEAGDLAVDDRVSERNGVSVGKVLWRHRRHVVGGGVPRVCDVMLGTRGDLHVAGAGGVALHASDDLGPVHAIGQRVLPRCLCRMGMRRARGVGGTVFLSVYLDFCPIL